MSKHSVIILGAGRPFRGKYPSSLIRTDSNHRVLDWIMEAFNGVLKKAEFHFVGGYCFDEVVKNYSNLFFSLNPNWKTSGSLGSLLVVPLVPDQTTYVCYSDVVFRKKIVRLLHKEDDDVVIVVDQAWRHRYESRSRQDLEAAEKVCIVSNEVRSIGTDIKVEEASGEFVGLMKLAPKAIKKIIYLQENGYEDLVEGNIPRLINILQKSGLNIRALEIEGDWAELNAPQDLARFVLGTKAETLKRLQPLVKHSVIDNQVSFTVGEWGTSRNKVLHMLKNRFGSNLLVIRSSALSEDNWMASQAGVYTSLLNIPGTDSTRIVKAIEEVIRSYDDDDPSHQVLIQSMLSNIEISGVVFTRTLNHSAPYYTINYDDTTSDTQTVTAGTGKNLITVVSHRNLDQFPKEIDSRLSHVIKGIKELEELIGYDSLDIEFAMTADGMVHIMQIRPLFINEGNYVLDSNIERTLQTAKKMFCQRQEPGPFVVGRRTFFGVMPDWNPAEIIGTKPRLLALTLYQYLFTDEIWAKQRAEYGYRDVRPHPLLITFGGHPFIDVRASFNSFIPASIPEPLAEQLVEHYLDLLEERPYLHDKIEFDIVFSCLSFDFEKQAQRLIQGGFKKKDIDILREALREITKSAMKRCTGDLNSIEILKKRFELLQEKNLDPLDKAYFLLEDCKQYGTLAFAHLARTGFIAVSLLNSLEEMKITLPEHKSSFLYSLRTVAGMLQRDGDEVANGTLKWGKFVSIYGHLRPGTYEITSTAYFEDPEYYLKPIVHKYQALSHSNQNKPVWDNKTKLLIASKLKEFRFADDVDEFENFLRRAIEGREYAKFVFSRNLSTALDSFIRFGKLHGISRDHLSHLSHNNLLDIRKGRPLGNIGNWLAAKAKEEKENHLVAQAIEMPALIMHEENLTAFDRPCSQPNYITKKKVVSKIIILSKDGSPVTNIIKNDLHGKIILIPNADPGFDWLFGHEIGGLVTMYGGANSHMSIRAAEFGVPAVIGAGESLYNQLVDAKIIELDCSSHLIKVVQ
ncbi:MAG TPA: PEP-utilizing enzyme [Nitrospinota bacterium]|jgi:choline kinase/phosphohistidine swiveling domain-containing protein|nr:PEP-utilizing enzyme [Nitrospinota bacterium]|tara:strand:- start:5078 stop:8149 length:3072 start_codon:yes stop_codon:yes gene_type:complete